MKSQIILDFAKAQSFENEVLSIALQAFYDLSEEKLENFWGCLKDNFGKSSSYLKLMKENRENWQNYYTSPSYDIQKQILAFIPNFADENTRFELLKLEMLYFMAFFGKPFYNDRQKDFSEINKDFKYFFECADKIPHFTSNWYSTSCYSKVQIENLGKILKYILELNLLHCYQGFYEDFPVLLSRLQSFREATNLHYNSSDCALFCNYHINVCSLFIQYDNIWLQPENNYILLQKFNPSQPPQINEPFEKQIREFLSAEMQFLNTRRDLNKIDGTIMQKDLEIFLNQCELFIKSPNESTLKADLSNQNLRVILDFHISSKTSRRISVFSNLLSMFFGFFIFLFCFYVLLMIIEILSR